MPKELLIDGENCVGCCTCEMVCSAYHEGIINPFQSRIKVVKWDRDGEGIPTTCIHCIDAPCKAICPVSAISCDEALARIVIDYKRCIGCRMCIAACPFGLIHFDSIRRRVIKCDLCDGDPICVKFCPYEALQYVDESALDSKKRRSSAEMLRAILRRPTGVTLGRETYNGQNGKP